MRSYTFLLSAISASALAAGLTLTSASAFARQTDPAQQSSNAQEQITVVAPRIMRTKVRGTSVTGNGVGYYDLMTLTHRVPYADLNLAKPKGAKMLKNRIHNAAEKICNQLAETPPARLKSPQWNQECVHRAVTNAMLDAHIAIAEARRQ